MDNMLIHFDVSEKSVQYACDSFVRYSTGHFDPVSKFLENLVNYWKIILFILWIKTTFQ